MWRASGCQTPPAYIWHLHDGTAAYSSSQSSVLGGRKQQLLREAAILLGAILVRPATNCALAMPFSPAASQGFDRFPRRPLAKTLTAKPGAQGTQHLWHLGAQKWPLQLLVACGQTLASEHFCIQEQRGQSPEFPTGSSA